MIAVRLSKIAIVAVIALFFTVVAFGNITDYGTNWQLVQHVLSMDTRFPEFDRSLARNHQRTAPDGLPSG